MKPGKSFFLNKRIFVLFVGFVFVFNKRSCHGEIRVGQAGSRRGAKKSVFPHGNIKMVFLSLVHGNQREGFNSAERTRECLRDKQGGGR